MELLWFLLCEIMWYNDSEGTVAAQTLFFRESQHQDFLAYVLPELLILVYVV